MFLYTTGIDAKEVYYMPNSKEFRPFTEEEIQHREEVFALIEKLPTYSAKMATIRTYFDENKEYTKEFIDSALHWAISAGTPIEQAQAHFDFFDYYGIKTNRVGTKCVLENITKIARAYPCTETYYFYFQAWALRLQNEILVGETEKARFNIEDMLREAELLNNNDGRFFAYFLSVLLLSNDESPKKNRAILEYLEKAKRVPNLSLMQQRWLESRYYMYYMRTGEKEKARKALTKEIELLEKTIIRYPERERKLQSMFLRNYVRLSVLFDRENEADSVRYYLEKAQNHYNDNFIFPAYINYQLEWAKYYYAQEEWENSILHYERALIKGKNQHPRFLMNIHTAKAELLEKLGREKEAAVLYHKLVLQKDSLNQAILKSHQIAHEKNFQIEQLLQKHITRQQMAYRYVILAMLILGIALGYIIHLVSKNEREIKKKRNQIKEVYSDVERENNLKRFFLKNVIDQINSPLDQIMLCADKLSLENNISKEERHNYSKQIKENSNRILTLVLNVLDLSRLEVGMVKYSCSSQNIVELCQDAIEEIKKEGNDLHLIEFECSYTTMIGEVDSLHLGKILKHALEAPYQLNESLHTLCQLTYEDGKVIIKVINSPIFKDSKQENDIAENIISLITKQLGGTYSKKEGTKETIMQISLPMLLTSQLH